MSAGILIAWPPLVYRSSFARDGNISAMYLHE
jgi:hypothetical protein